MQKEEEVEGTSQGYSWPAQKKAVFIDRLCLSFLNRRWKNPKNCGVLKFYAKNDGAKPHTSLLNVPACVHIGC